MTFELPVLMIGEIHWTSDLENPYKSNVFQVIQMYIVKYIECQNNEKRKDLGKQIHVSQ